jgi:hypothetical protein
MLLLSPKILLFHKEFNLLLPLGKRVVEIEVPNRQLVREILLPAPELILQTWISP